MEENEIQETMTADSPCCGILKVECVKLDEERSMKADETIEQFLKRVGSLLKK